MILLFKKAFSNVLSLASIAWFISGAALLVGGILTILRIENQEVSFDPDYRAVLAMIFGVLLLRFPLIFTKTEALRYIDDTQLSNLYAPFSIGEKVTIDHYKTTIARRIDVASLGLKNGYYWLTKQSEKSILCMKLDDGIWYIPIDYRHRIAFSKFSGGQQPKITKIERDWVLTPVQSAK